MARDEDEDEGSDEGYAASHLVIMAYGDDREYVIEQCAEAFREQGIAHEVIDDGSVHATLRADALSMLDDLAGYVGDPVDGTLIQAGLIMDDGELIPISQAWESWQEMLDDVEDHLEEYLERYAGSD